ncbi:MAG: heavy-metal-associated domain-containing protein [Turicibacter sp.]|nr:heavy-metal-associated domain-containing protein [Turicibacter sp.]
MSKTFILNIQNLNTEADSGKIREYLLSNLDGIEELEINLPLSLVTVKYTESIGSPKYILDALDRLGYTVR